MSAEVPFKEHLECDVCGKFGAFEFDGRKLCAGCYEASGSCCPEFGNDEAGTPSEAKENRNVNRWPRQQAK